MKILITNYQLRMKNMLMEQWNNKDSCCYSTTAKLITPCFSSGLENKKHSSFGGILVCKAPKS